MAHRIFDIESQAINRVLVDMIMHFMEQDKFLKRFIVPLNLEIHKIHNIKYAEDPYGNCIQVMFLTGEKGRQEYFGSQVNISDIELMRIPADEVLQYTVFKFLDALKENMQDIANNEYISEDIRVKIENVLGEIKRDKFLQECKERGNSYEYNKNVFHDMFNDDDS